MVKYLGQLLGMAGKIIVGGFLIIFMIAFGGAILSFQNGAEAIASAKYTYLYGNSDSQNHLLKINVAGPILGLPPQGVPGPFNFLAEGAGTYGYAVKKALRNAANDSSIHGVFIHMSTPGGTIYGSMAIYDGIKAYQEKTGNPVLVYIEGMAASGGVMAMVGADAIYADTGSLIGSIGVIGGEFYYYDEPLAINGGILGGGITTGKGIEQTVITAGRGKDFGNPYRRPSAEELTTWQASVDALYKKFVAHVSSDRGISENTIVDDMGAQVFGNGQALAYGLIDGSRTWEEAIGELAKLAKVENDFQLVRKRGPELSAFERLFLMMAPKGASEVTATKILQNNLCAAAHLQALVYFGSPSSLCPAG